jgi:prenyltransferase beta subunit
MIPLKHDSRGGALPALALILALAAGLVFLAMSLPPQRLSAAPAGASATTQQAGDLDNYKKPLDQATDKALEYLARQQDKDGCWPASGLNRNTAVASLAVMAFMAKGHTPGSGPYGQVMNKGIDFVLSCRQANGMLVSASSHGPMYEHCISTLMLSEASGMVDAQRQTRLDQALAGALKNIIAAQQVKKDAAYAGGWRYQINSPDSDISCTGWALMALRSARNNGAAVPAECIDKAVGFVLRCRDSAYANAPAPKEGVGFCYQPGSGPGLARTGTALLCLELCGKHRCPQALDGGEWILSHPPAAVGGEYFYYGLYYTSQAMFQLGDSHWHRYAPRMYDMLLKAQKPDGSFPQGGSSESAAGVNYATAMAVLAMSVECCQLPIYQR